MRASGSYLKRQYTKDITQKTEDKDKTVVDR